jgi:hypothetical protein
MKKIIDYHGDVSNISLLQDKVLDIFITYREDMYSKFASKIMTENSKVDKSLLNDAKDEIRKQVALRMQAETDRDKAISMISNLVKTINDCKLDIQRLTLDNETLSTNQLANQQASQQINNTDKVKELEYKMNNLILEHGNSKRLYEQKSNLDLQQLNDKHKKEIIKLENKLADQATKSKQFKKSKSKEEHIDKQAVQQTIQQDIKKDDVHIDTHTDKLVNEHTNEQNDKQIDVFTVDDEFAIDFDD